MLSWTGGTDLAPVWGDRPRSPRVPAPDSALRVLGGQTQLQPRGSRVAPDEMDLPWGSPGDRPRCSPGEAGLVSERIVYSTLPRVPPCRKINMSPAHAGLIGGGTWPRGIGAPLDTAPSSRTPMRCPAVPAPAEQDVTVFRHPRDPPGRHLRQGCAGRRTGIKAF